MLRTMVKEHWNIRRVKFDINKKGYGSAIYEVDTLKQTYSITFIKTLVTIKKAQMKQRFLVTG